MHKSCCIKTWLTIINNQSGLSNENHLLKHMRGRSWRNALTEPWQTRFKPQEFMKTVCCEMPGRFEQTSKLNLCASRHLKSIKRLLSNHRESITEENLSALYQYLKRRSTPSNLSECKSSFHQASGISSTML